MFKKSLLYLILLAILFQAGPAEADGGLKMAAANVIENLADGQYDKVYNQFDGVMKGALPLKALQETWESVLLQFGPYRGQSANLPLDVPASYWLDLRAYDPLRVAQTIDLPFLLLQGGRDYQVTGEDFELWRSALINRRDVEFILYPDLNHLFSKGEGKSRPEEYGFPAEVDQAVITDIAVWLKKQIK